MTLEEFQQKLASVSDRRLLRILNRAESEGLAPAIALVKAEQDRRKIAASQRPAATGPSVSLPQQAPVFPSENQPAQEKVTSAVTPTEKAARIPAINNANGHARPPGAKSSEASEKEHPINRQTQSQRNLLGEDIQDLTSQIRPLEEVLGRQFEWDMETRSSDDTDSLSPEFFGESELENSIAKVGANSVQPESTDEGEEMAPINASRHDWIPQEKGFLESSEKPSAAVQTVNQIAEAQRKHRAWAIVAIILLFVAGCLAIWRALVA